MPNPRTLVLALHHSASAVDALRAALAEAGLEATIGRKVYGELSGAYRAAAARHAKAPSMIAALAEDMGIREPIESFGRIVAISWSAGYGWVDSALDHGEPIDGWIALDSGYGTPHPGVIELARAALRGEKLYAAVYTDIETKPAYASTGDYLEGVQRAAGEASGLFTVEHQAHDAAALAASHDVAAFWRNEHVNAYRRGPAMLVAALCALDARDGAAAPVAQTSG